MQNLRVSQGPHDEREGEGWGVGGRRSRKGGRQRTGKGESLAASSSRLLDVLTLADLEVRLCASTGGHGGRAHSALIGKTESVSLAFDWSTRRARCGRERRSRKTYRSLICLAIVKKACSTLVASLADVSRKGMPSESANS